MSDKLPDGGEGTTASAAEETGTESTGNVKLRGDKGTELAYLHIPLETVLQQLAIWKLKIEKGFLKVCSLYLSISIDIDI